MGSPETFLRTVVTEGPGALSFSSTDVALLRVDSRPAAGCAEATRHLPGCAENVIIW